MCLAVKEDYPNPEENEQGPFYRYKYLAIDKYRSLYSPIFPEKWEMDKWNTAIPQKESRDQIDACDYEEGITIKGSEDKSNHGFHVFTSYGTAQRKKYLLRLLVPEAARVVVKVEVQGFVAGNLSGTEESWKEAKVVEIIG